MELETIERKLTELITFDENLRKNHKLSGVYGPWDQKYPYFSIGDGKDNKYVFTGTTPIHDGNCNKILIDGSGKEDNKFMITHIKDESGTNENIFSLKLYDV